LNEYDHDLFHPGKIAPARARVLIKMCLRNAKRLLTFPESPSVISGQSKVCNRFRLLF
jgi:hypothetical protein